MEITPLLLGYAVCAETDAEAPVVEAAINDLKSKHPWSTDRLAIVYDLNLESAAPLLAPIGKQPPHTVEANFQFRAGVEWAIQQIESGQTTDRVLRGLCLPSVVAEGIASGVIVAAPVVTADQRS
jgi:hypothetical protein